MRVAGAGGVMLHFFEERVRHQAEDEVEGERADGGEAVDVAKVQFAAEEEEGAEEGEEEDRPGEVGVGHDVLVDVGEGVEDGEGLVLGSVLSVMASWSRL